MRVGEAGALDADSELRVRGSGIQSCGAHNLRGGGRQRQGGSGEGQEGVGIGENEALDELNERRKIREKDGDVNGRRGRGE